MLELSADSANELFAAACEAVLGLGTPVAPRGIATVEVLGATLTLTDPRRRLVDVPPVRVLNPAFAAAEATWILAGSDEPWIYEYNRGLAKYADRGRLMGAYGPRLRRWNGGIDQLSCVYQVLREDPASRRAVVQLFDPARDFGGHKDVPCTLGHRFFLRDGRLHMYTSMRSQDLWLGFCYDLFTATLIQELMAGWLGAGIGDYCVRVDSLHLYERDLLAARQVPARAERSALAVPLSVPWAALDGVLSQVVAGTPPVTGGWAEIAAVMASYRAWKAGDREAACELAASHDGPLAEALGRWYDRLAGKERAAAGAGEMR